MTRSRSTLLAAVWLAACSPTALELSADDAASPGAQSAPLAASPPTLHEGFDPFDAYAEDAPEGAHEHSSRAEPHGDHGQAATTHTCPMHPEVRGGEGDRCPKCGMKLVPRGKDE